MNHCLIIRAYKKYLNYRELIWSFVRRDIDARYKGTVMGACWSLIHPLAAFSVYLLVFGFFLKVRMPASTSVLDFALYFSAGYFPWVFFSGVVTRAASCIVDNRNFIKKVSFPSEIFPSTIALSEGVSLVISIAIVGAFSIYLKGFSVLLLLLPIVMLLEVIFSLACALLVSAATVFFRDVPQLLSSLFMVWFWLTPITYTADMVPKKLELFVYLNPIHHLLALYRSLLFNGTMLNVKMLLLFAIFSGIFLYCSLQIFRRAKRHFSDML